MGTQTLVIGKTPHKSTPLLGTRVLCLPVEAIDFFLGKEFSNKTKCKRLQRTFRLLKCSYSNIKTTVFLWSYIKQLDLQIIPKGSIISG